MRLARRGDDRVRQGRRAATLRSTRSRPSSRRRRGGCVVGVAAGLALIASGLREAVVAGACLVLIFLIGLWQDSMETLVQVLIATVITFALGLALGIASSRSDRFATRPATDPRRRCRRCRRSSTSSRRSCCSTRAGSRPSSPRSSSPSRRSSGSSTSACAAVSPTIKEAAVSYGRQQPAAPRRRSSCRSPARPSSWPLNQAVILVLSMVVVGGLVGGQALGFDVVAGFSQEPPVRDGAGRRDRAGPARDHARPDDPRGIRTARAPDTVR